MELDILSRLGRGISYSSMESVLRRSSIRCGFMFGTGPMVPDSSFEPVLEPDRVRCRSMPGKVSEVRNPSPCWLVYSGLFLLVVSTLISD